MVLSCGVVGWDDGARRAGRAGAARARGGRPAVDRGEGRTRDGIATARSSSTTARGQANVCGGQRHIRRDMLVRLGRIRTARQRRLAMRDHILRSSTALRWRIADVLGRLVRVLSTGHAERAVEEVRWAT
jgi:hypothetical protein